MKINEEGLELLKRSESCRLTSYKDAVGIWTIGWGHTGRDVRPGYIIDQATADKLLQDDLLQFEEGITDYLEVELNDNQFSALVVFTYNVGLGNFQKSHLLKYVNQSQFDKAANEFQRWTRAGGIVLEALVRRRAAERELFLK